MNNELLTSNEIKENLSHILYDFANYCDENDLYYVLAYGTLLGAVRHKGFIPWDDDIDLFMPRNDYERLHELVKYKPIRDNYQLKSVIAGNSCISFAKIVDTNIELIEGNNNTDTNLWIDIFPLDGLSNKQIKHMKCFQKMISLILHMLMKSDRKIEWCGVRTTLIILICHLLPSQFYGKLLNKIAKRHSIEDCEYVANIAFCDAYLYLNKNDVLNRCRLNFEGNEYWVPKNYNSVLKTKYGDTYMTLPPEDKRECHNFKARIINK